jgi:hypothetical protein
MMMTVVPAQAGTQFRAAWMQNLGPRLRGGDVSYAVEMGPVEDFLQVSCENRGTRIVMPGLQAPRTSHHQGHP